MKQLAVILTMMLLLLSCSGRRQLSPEELSQKLDSVKNVEINEHLNQNEQTQKCYSNT